MKRTERLFAITEYLRSRRTGVTAESLAERFGVTVRTIYRDLDSLRSASLPLLADRGRGGGYALSRSYSLPPVNFNAREAAILLSACGWLAQMRVIPFLATLRSAQDKVRSALGKSVQSELNARLQELLFVGVPQAPIRDEVRGTLEDAWFEQRPLLISYSSNGRTSERRVLLRQIVMERSVTFLNCHDLDLHDDRQFRLDRIDRAEILLERC